MAVMLIGSMVPALLAPSSRAATSSLYGSYSHWLRAQLRVPADAAFERALLRAAESDAKSFEQFVHAFFQAYEAHGAGVPVSKVFTGRDLSNAALWSYLQRRYTRIGGDGVLHRVRFVTAAGCAATAASGDVAFAARTYEVAHATLDTGMHGGSDIHFTSVGILTSARPQGP